MAAKTRALFIVDPNRDFVEDGQGPFRYTGKLLVPGAWGGAVKLAAMMDRHTTKIDDLFVSSDCHHAIGIERPRFWARESDGAEPAPFTCLSIHPDGKRIVKTILDATGAHPTEEVYVTRQIELLHQGGVTGKGAFGYIAEVTRRGRYPVIVWTEHCVVGTYGQSFVEPISEAINKWERDNLGSAVIIAKGNNPYTEHYSAVMAEVEDPQDPTTRLNTRVIGAVEQYDEVGVAGWALSHCLANTFRDICNNFRDPAAARKLRLITDATANVAGFDFMGDAFVKEMMARGMEQVTTETWLA